MSGSMFDLVYAGNTVSTLLGSSSLLAGGMYHCPCCGRVSDQAHAAATNQAANVAHNSDWQRWSAAQMMNAWSTPLPREPGVYWRRTGGKTHTVEVVR